MEKLHHFVAQPVQPVTDRYDPRSVEMCLVGDRHDVIVRLRSVLTWHDLEEVPPRVIGAQRQLVDFTEAHRDDSLQSGNRSTNKGGGTK